MDIRWMATTGVLLCFLPLSIWTCHRADHWRFERSFSLGTIQPVGIAYDQGRLWISDPASDRVVEIDTTGNLKASYEGFARPMHLAAFDSAIYVPEFLIDSISVIQEGAAARYPFFAPLNAPAGLSASDRGVAVANFYGHDVVVTENERTRTIATKGHGAGELYYPTDIAWFEELLYVADAYNNRVQVFDLLGRVRKVIGEGDSLKVASGIFVDDEEIFVTDFDGDRVLVYDHDGGRISVIREYVSGPIDLVAPGNRLYVANYRARSVSVFVRE